MEVKAGFEIEDVIHEEKANAHRKTSLLKRALRSMQRYMIEKTNQDIKSRMQWKFFWHLSLQKVFTAFRMNLHLQINRWLDTI